ncbi:MAG: ABC transporter substrate-binding protein [Thermoprotei archaeon]
MRTIGANSMKGASTKTVLVALIVVVIIVVAVGVIFTRSPRTTSTSTGTTSQTTTSSTTLTSTSTSQTTSTSTFTLNPPNRSQLVDNYQQVAPDALDPAQAFGIEDEPMLTAVYQELVEFNGSSINQVIPVLASNYTVLDNSKTFVFTIRQNVTFSNGDPLTPAAVWFSFVREVYDGQAVGISNYEELTLNLSEVSATGYDFPWGIRAAIQAATGLPATTNVSVAVAALNNIMSNFNPDNATIQKVMEYPNQAYVVSGADTFTINLLKPYSPFLLDIASWWGAIVDPAFVDAHGGVQGNKPNAYINNNGSPGTGPYEFAYVAPGLSTIVLKTNPRYWDVHGTGILSPPSIPTIIINYALTQNQQIESFASNQAQISYAGVTNLGQMYAAYQYKKYYGFNQIFVNAGSEPGVQMLALNTQVYPTSNVNFRLALAHAINFSLILDKVFTYNGTQLASTYVGPISPQFPEFYNPDNLTPYSYNIQLAIDYLNKAGLQEGFSVTLPNGTVIGNTSAPPLQPLSIVNLAPLPPYLQEEMTIIVTELQQIGLTVGIENEAPSIFYTTWTSPQVTPAITWFAWYPDWPDPIFQQLAPAVTTTSYFPAWMNLTVVNNIMATLPFLTNTTQQRQLVAEIYNITYNYAPYIWLPNPITYYFVQPYVQGFIYNPFTGYYYNTMHYT